MTVTHIHIHKATKDYGVPGMKKGQRKQSSPTGQSKPPSAKPLQKSELGLTGPEHAGKAAFHKAAMLKAKNPREQSHHFGQAQMHEYYAQKHK